MEVFCTSPHQLYHHQQSMNASANSFVHQIQERTEENWYWKSYEESKEEEDDEFLERFMKELDLKGHEMVKKLISKVERNVPFEEELRDTWHHLKGKPASRMLEKIARKVGREREGDSRVMMRERGLDSELEGEMKNERFKVKTVNGIGSGVVKEEGREKK